MKTLINNVWFRRAVPIVLIVAAYFGYTYYTEQKREQLEQTETEYASVTAHIWVASALYRNDTERLTEYRDSLLAAHDLTTEQLETFVERYKNAETDPGEFTGKVKRKVDSLVAVYNERQKTRQRARLVARMLMASVLYEQAPKRLKKYRDSVLAGKDVSESQLDSLINVYSAATVDTGLFVGEVDRLVDSLLAAYYAGSLKL